ncbi:hypothetical protein ACFVWR_18470 [Leifsonia sp. NPDC058292]|uniref:hypothetical protein n=1 Tax=Leifsonia sp. NPDC058292 TaxID=3346428 RepID=UPI0036DF9066
MSGRGEDILATEYLYAIKADSYEGDDSRYHKPKHVVRFPIQRKTAKRIYYVADTWGPKPTVRFVDRQKMESEGEVYTSRHWSASDFHLYMKEPILETASEPTLAQLKSAMREAHPDMGGSHEAFLTAHQRYEKARSKSSRTEGER